MRPSADISRYLKPDSPPSSKETRSAFSARMNPVGKEIPESRKFTMTLPSWRLDGKNVIVTGGTNGIGFAIAEQLIDLGARVLICSRTSETVSSAVARLNAQAEAARPGQFARAVGCACDVSTSEGRGVLVRAARAHFGLDGLDGLVNNVGTNVRLPIEECTDEMYRSMVRLARKIQQGRPAQLFHGSPFSLRTRFPRDGGNRRCPPTWTRASSSAATSRPCSRRPGARWSTWPPRRASGAPARAPPTRRLRRGKGRRGA